MAKQNLATVLTRSDGSASAVILTHVLNVYRLMRIRQSTMYWRMKARFGNRKLNPYREIAMEYNLERVGEKEEMSFIHDRGGVEIGTMFVENRFSLPLEKIPAVFVDAVLAQEDQRFYAHDGVDWVGVARAAWLNFQSGSITQGAGNISFYHIF